MTGPSPWNGERDQLIRQGRDEFRGLNVVHFPLAFPHVFRDTRGGFDVIVGNPPWEKVKVEEHVFWARYFPGLRACPQREREALKARYRDERPDLVAALSREIESTTRLRRLLTQGAFPGMGAGDPDLHKAFAWRFWGLAAPEGGRIGVVLPREAWSAYGSTKFREKVLAGAREIDVTMLTNTGQWVFESHPQSTIAITSITKGQIKARGGGPLVNPLQVEHWHCGVHTRVASNLKPALLSRQSSSRSGRSKTGTTLRRFRCSHLTRRPRCSPSFARVRAST